MIDFDKVYSFDDADKRGSFRATTVNKDLQKEYLFSSVDDGIEIEFCWFMGSTLFDVLPTGFAGIYLVSEKVKSVLDSSNFKGYCLRRISLLGKRKESIDGYWLLSIISKVGPILNERSQKREMPPIVPWADPYEAYYGLFFDPATWDGSDFFRPENMFYTFVLEGVKDIFEKKKITNCEFKKVSEVQNMSMFKDTTYFQQ
jgi:hypothetical protein